LHAAMKPPELPHILSIYPLLPLRQLVPENEKCRPDYD